MVLPDNKSLKILITDAQELAGLGAIRSLGRAGHNITAGYPSLITLPSSVLSRWCASSITYPDPWEDQHNFSKWLIKEISNKKYDAVLPIAEASLFAVSQIRDEVERYLLPILPSKENLRYCLSKYHAMKAAMEAHIPVAPTVFIYDGSPDSQWTDDLSDIEYPIVLKTDNYLAENGAYRRGKLYYAQNSAEAEIVLDKCREFRCGIIAQRYIPGSGSASFFLRWGDTVYLSFSHRRIHEIPWTGGASSFRESCHNENLKQYGEKLLHHINYQGVAMVEFRQDIDTGIPYFMEINGRLWGSLALALHAGVDFPAALIDCYSRGSPKNARMINDYQDGIKCRNVYPGEVTHVITVLDSQPTVGKPVPPSKSGTILKFFLLFFDLRVRHDYFWWNDPIPGIMQSIKMLHEVGVKVRDKIRSMYKTWKKRRLIRSVKKKHEKKIKSHKPYFSLSPQNILFICYGNIYRSAFAELYWNQVVVKRYSLLSCYADSAGVYHKSGRSIPDKYSQYMQIQGIYIASHRSRIVTDKMIEENDLIFIMDYANWEDMACRVPEKRSKLFFLGLFSGDENIEIDDPYLMGPAEAEECFIKLSRALDGLAIQISSDDKKRRGGNPAFE